MDLNTFLQDDTTLPCNCANSPFADKHHNHIITGDLKIVENNKLRKLLSKGPNHREPVAIDFDKAKEEILSGIETLVTNWAKKAQVDKRLFNGWRIS